MENNNKVIGYTCSYTPLVLIDAAGFIPYRIMPDEKCSDHAGGLLHDNLCSHVKRVLDRAVENKLPQNFAGLVIMNSCDSMRRLKDAWIKQRPNDKVIISDLPINSSGLSVDYFADELIKLKEMLEELKGNSIDESSLYNSIKKYNKLCELFSELKNSKMYFSDIQEHYNQAVKSSFKNSINRIENLLIKTKDSKKVYSDKHTKLFLFGNYLPEPEAIRLFESCGAAIVSDDICTGSKTFDKINIVESKDIYKQLAYLILNRPPCARTLKYSSNHELAESIEKSVKLSNAEAVIIHTLKFCDPYLSRIPYLRNYLKDKGIPVLLLEGDCSLRSIEQHKTRIEAFLEMMV